MRILVFEFFSGGGLAGRDAAMSIAREGAAMRDALTADLAAIGAHRIVATVDARFPLNAARDIVVVAIDSGRRDALDAAIDSVDAVWLIAPETDRCLERLAARVESRGRILLGPSAAAIRPASDKGALPARLARCGVPHPATRVLRGSDDCLQLARELGYPVVVKPARGAGCEGVRLASDPRALLEAVDDVRREAQRGSQERASESRSAKALAGRSTAPRRAFVLQQYVPGIAASVSLLCDGHDAVALTVNRQSVRIGSGPAARFSYRGGHTPFDHPLSAQAADAAVRAVRAVPGLRGFVGVDVVLARTGPVVIEVNPRLTTAFLGVRMAIRENVAALALEAFAGRLPRPPATRQSVHFTGEGRVTCHPR